VAEEGIFSGCALVTREGVPALVYYGINAGICIAFAEDDDLVGWRRHPANPVIAEPKRGDPAFDVYRVFDPHAWFDGDIYHMILGGLVKPHNVRDTAYLFTSTDLEHWDYQRPFYSPNPNWTDTNEDCACPDFFKLGSRHVLMCISHPRGTRYYLGRYHAGTFIPDSHHRLTYPGGASFAPESLLDGMGRRVFWAWAIAQRRPGTDQFASMTLPSVLTATDSGGLMIEPAREVELLRRNARATAALTLDDDERLFPALAGDCLELRLAIQPRGARRAGLSVRAAPNRIEETPPSLLEHGFRLGDRPGAFELSAGVDPGEQVGDLGPAGVRANASGVNPSSPAPKMISDTSSSPVLRSAASLSARVPAMRR